MKYLFLLLFLGNSANAFDRVDGLSLSARHMLMMTADLEHIWGTYFFAVINDSKEEKQWHLPVPLPKETVDFKPGEGLTSEDLRLEGSEVYISKKFAPGLNLVGIGFKTQVNRFGSDFLTLQLPFSVDELSVASSQDSGLQFEAKGFSVAVPSMLSSDHYRGIQSDSNLRDASTVEVRILGIPKNRSYIQVVSIGFSLLLLSLSIFSLRRYS